MNIKSVLSVVLTWALSVSLMFPATKAFAASDVENVLGAIVAIDQIFGGGKKSGNSGNINAASLSNQKHARPNPTHNEKLFMLAVEEHDIGTVKEMLAAGVDVNGVYNIYSWINTHDEGITAFLTALRNDDRDMMQFLLENGADVNGFYDLNNNYKCYLVFATRWITNVNVLEYLHNWGADINGKNYDGQNALYSQLIHVSTGGWSSDSVLTRVEYLCKNGINIDVIINNANYNRTPFLMAIATQNIKLANLLASYGANLKARDNQGKNALDIALETNNIQVYKAVQDILARGQQPSIYREKMKTNAKNNKKVL